jgi:hypothetical protein
MHYLAIFFCLDVARDGAYFCVTLTRQCVCVPAFYLMMETDAFTETF